MDFKSYFIFHLISGLLGAICFYFFDKYSFGQNNKKNKRSDKND